MELNINASQKLDFKQIYEMLFNIVNDKYFYELVLREISDSKKSYSENQNYIDFIKSKIKIQSQKELRNYVEL